MTLLDLPYEILEYVIADIMPEGFESLALTCKRSHALCEPFFKRHQQLKSDFSTFTYCDDRCYAEHHRTPGFIPTAIELIARIAEEPVAARYIRHAHLDRGDDPPFNLSDVKSWTECRGASLVPQMLADSPYLEWAGIDWRDYFAKMDEELKDAFFSPRAAAFLMTLLPNVETLRLPWKWRCQDSDIERLISAVVERAREPAFAPGSTPSLANVTDLVSRVTGGLNPQLPIDERLPFFALPRLRTLSASNCLAVYTGYREQPSKGLISLAFGENLETVDFCDCALDETAIVSFLRQTPQLKELQYLHGLRRDNRYNPDMDMCAFFNAIARQAGSHLERLSLRRRSWEFVDLSLATASPRAQDFERLRELSLDLDFVLQSMQTAKAARTGLDVVPPAATAAHLSQDRSPEQDRNEGSLSSLLLGEIVPASIRNLDFWSDGKERHSETLHTLFYSLAAVKDVQIPCLEKICLRRDSQRGSPAYSEQCRLLQAQARKVNVHFTTNDLAQRQYARA